MKRNRLRATQGYTYDESRRLFLRRSGLASAALLFGGISARASSEGDCPPAVRTDSGPFYPRVPIPAGADLTVAARAGAGSAEGAIGRRLYLYGRITDRDCRPLAGARVEIWQADHRGLYRHQSAEAQADLDPNFRYFAHVVTDKSGRYRFKTIVPHRYRFMDIDRAPHVHYRVQHPGSRTLITEMYFRREEDARLRSEDRVFRGRDRASRDRMIVAPRPPETAPDLGPGIEPDAVCCEYDLALT